MEIQVGQILQNELARRCSRNPRYSLRSFAKALDISPANLSLILNSKRAPSKKTADKMLRRLDLDIAQREALLSYIGVGPTAEPINMDLERAQKICDWRCYAILSLFHTKGFQENEAWIAKRLGISIHETRSALAALVEAGCLDMKSSGWEIMDEIRIDNRISTAKIREFHRELIGKATDAMETLPADKRNISSITFAMSPEKMELAKAEIRKFRLRMSRILEEPGRSTEVFNLTVQLTPITRGNT